MTQRLLIADRWRLVAEHLRMLFIERGFEIEVATDGLDCLAKIQTYGPDAILIDEDLPWGGGAGVAAWLRDEMLRPIPVVMMTSSRHGGNDNNGIQYVQRPFRTATLLRTVATALDSAEPLTIDTASQVARHERVTSER
ncbi:response regulator [Planctellipticum variicoloris]|uniref:response regulator n=1 Tax=Planctellipticum variicoloris TaxID=3064265 RepID=UPI00301404FB|nr:response regulator [Planctomycetaceae bacterium SH412]